MWMAAIIMLVCRQKPKRLPPALKKAYTKALTDIEKAALLKERLFCCFYPEATASLAVFALCLSGFQIGAGFLINPLH